MKITNNVLKKLIKEVIEEQLPGSVRKKGDMRAKAEASEKKAHEALENRKFKLALSYINNAIKLAKLSTPEEGDVASHQAFLRRLRDFKDSLTRGPG